MAAEIQRQDIISDEALAAPLQLSRNIDIATASLRELVKVSSVNVTNVRAAESTAKLTKETESLSLAQQELIKVQKQIAIAQAKESEAYQTGLKTLNAYKQAAKEKNSIDLETARNTNVLTSSITQLEQALKRNREAYNNLSSAEQRASKDGQELLRIIQAQDKSFKELKGEMGQHQSKVGDYANAISGLDGRFGSLIEGVKKAKEQFATLGLVGGTVIAILGLIAAAFVLIREAASSYYHATLEGEEEFQANELKAEARLKVYKDTWVDFGSTVAFILEDIKKGYRDFIDVFASDEQEKAIEKNMEIAERAAKQQAQNFRDHIKDVVDDGRTEIAVNQDLADSKDKLNKTDEERLDLIRDARRLIEEQAIGDLELALADEKANQLKLESQGKLLINGKLLADYTDEELLATKLTNEELTKTAQLQATTLKIESDLAEKRKNFNKQESALVNEITADKLKAQLEIQKAIEETAKIAKEIADRELQYQVEKEKEEVRLKKDFDDKERERIKNLTAAEKAAWDEQFKAAQEHNEEVDELEQERFNTEKKRAEDLAKAKIKLEQTVFKFVKTSIDAGFINRIQDLNDQQQANDEAKAREIEAAGDNADQKAAIEKRYAAEQKKIQDAIKAEKRKQAEVDKALAITSIIVNTAKAVVEALPNIPLSVIVGLIGAFELATVAATPIPQFAKGTKSAPGGKAIVGELGAELMREPGKGWKWSPSEATLMDVKAGTEIKTHKDSMRMIALSAIGGEHLIDRENRQQLADIKELRDAINDSTDRTVKAIRENGGELLQHGSFIYRAVKNGTGGKNFGRVKGFGR